MPAWVATRDDAPDVTRLLIGFRDHLSRDWPPEPQWRAGVERLLGDPNTEFLLASVAAGGPAQGVCQLRFRYGLWLDATDAWLEDLFVDATARGSGLGRVLVEFAAERARLRNARRLQLDVHEANDPARSLYASAGFVIKPPGDRDILTTWRLDPTVR